MPIEELPRLSASQSQRGFVASLEKGGGGGIIAVCLGLEAWIVANCGCSSETPITGLAGRKKGSPHPHVSLHVMNALVVGMQVGGGIRVAGARA